MARHLLCAVLLCVCAMAWADGGFVPARTTATHVSSAAAQKGILVSEPGSEVLLLETTYHGPSSSFAWIIPVPEAPQEVFPANATFMDAILRQTSPVQVDHSVRDYSGGGRGGGAGLSGGQPSSSVASPVRVLARMTVGEYDAAVLAASRAAGGQAGDVVQWLQDNGYEVTDRLAQVLQPYVKDHWVFVALKLLPDVAEEKPLLKDVAPIGIRFRQGGGRLVFPLYISRLSAPPFTAIALVTIGTSSYRCQQFPVVRFEDETPIRRGETYGMFRRKMCRIPRPALLCEFCGGERLPALALSYKAGGRIPVKAALGGPPVVTRYFGYVQPQEMDDLELSPHSVSGEHEYAVLIERTGPRRQRWGSSPAAVDRFTADCGALPLRPEDLVDEPATGQDASGNEVPIAGWHGPYIDVGRGTPWDPRAEVFDPLNIVFADRTDMAGTIRPATLRECQAAEQDR